MTKYLLKKRDLLEIKNCSYRGMTQTYSKWKTIGKYETLDEADQAKRKCQGLYSFSIFYKGKRVDNY